MNLQPTSLPARVSAYIRRHDLLADGDAVLVALSGGADSVALLLCMQALGYDVRAAHVNFHLRGAASDADERFVRELCRRRGVQLFTRHFDTAAEARRTGESIEMAARRLRYDWFAELLKAGTARRVAVAHHREDNTETFFLNLLRGAGLHGLTAMAPRRGDVIRPLLATSRAEIEQYLNEEGQDYVTDETNYDVAYRRNNLRHAVLPRLRAINPSFDATLAQTLAALREADTVLHDETANYLALHRLWRGVVATWSATALLGYAAPRTLLHALLAPYGFTSAQQRDIREALYHTTGQLFRSTTHSVCLYRDTLQLCPTPRRVEALRIKIGANLLPGGRLLSAEISDETAISRDPDSATLDARRIVGDLFVRSVGRGDRFAPFGLRGTKLISDYLTDRHRSRLEREAALLLCDDAGPLWLLGERPDRRAAVNADTTRTLRLKLQRT